MDVSAIVTQLQGVASLQQVIAADPAGSPVSFDTSAALVSLLGSLVASRMYPISQREDPAHPSIVYQLIGSRQSEFDGFAITQTDTFLLAVRAADYDTVFDLVTAIKAALAGASAAVEAVDLLFDYDDEVSLFRANIELDYTYLCGASQALPAAFVYSLGRSAEPSPFDNFTRQRVTDSYAILICTTAGNVATLATDIRTALLGWQQSAAHDELEYSAGAQVAGIGGMRLWRETYADSILISEAPPGD